MDYTDLCIGWVDPRSGQVESHFRPVVSGRAWFSMSRVGSGQKEDPIATLALLVQAERTVSGCANVANTCGPCGYRADLWPVQVKVKSCTMQMMQPNCGLVDRVGTSRTCGPCRHTAKWWTVLVQRTLVGRACTYLTRCSLTGRGHCVQPG